MASKRNRDDAFGADLASRKKRDLESDDFEVVEIGEPALTTITVGSIGDAETNRPATQLSKQPDNSPSTTPDEFSWLKLDPNHETRSLWISPDAGIILFEAFSPNAEQVQAFLTSICEPVSRPALIHEYKLTPHSLTAAASVGLRAEDIIEGLSRMSKVPISDSTAGFIRAHMCSYGRVRLVLKQGKYWIESSDRELLNTICADETIKKACSTARLDDDGTKTHSPIDFSEDDDETCALEIQDTSIERVKQRCSELQCPMMEEYDFMNDRVKPRLNIDLKPEAMIRPYQESALSKMLRNGRARSGIIVLPCGAGKTLLGIMAACTIKKSCLVLCTSTVSVAQWEQQFLQWSTIQDNQISIFTAESKTKFTKESGVMVSTYSMVANTNNRALDAKAMMRWLTSQEWGLIVLDEVHVVPADMFRRAVSTLIFKTHCKLGLTATLVREDDKIGDLNYMIGPKLYEANWQELAAKGYIANVQCAEVWCPMTPGFYSAYLREQSHTRLLLSCMNPTKFQTCQSLIEYHETRGDKIIVFSDNIFALENYANKLGKCFIDGRTNVAERTEILRRFQSHSTGQTIFLSKIGDTSLDLPETTCIIQISSHFGSRRQEAQRLGRILRARRRSDDDFTAFFYSLVSTDTQEMHYSAKRQQFLVDQGYEIRVLTHLDGIEEMLNPVYCTQDEQAALLLQVLEMSKGRYPGISSKSPEQVANKGQISKNMARRSNAQRNKLFVRRDKDKAAARKLAQDRHG